MNNRSLVCLIKKRTSQGVSLNGSVSLETQETQFLPVFDHFCLVFFHESLNQSSSLSKTLPRVASAFIYRFLWSTSLRIERQAESPSFQPDVHFRQLCWYQWHWKEIWSCQTSQMRILANHHLQRFRGCSSNGNQIIDRQFMSFFLAVMIKFLRIPLRPKVRHSLNHSSFCNLRKSSQIPFHSLDTRQSLWTCFSQEGMTESFLQTTSGNRLKPRMISLSFSSICEPNTGQLLKSFLCLKLQCQSCNWTIKSDQHVWL